MRNRQPLQLLRQYGAKAKGAIKKSKSSIPGPQGRKYRSAVRVRRGRVLGTTAGSLLASGTIT